MSVDFLGREWPEGCMGCLVASGRMTPPGGLLYKSSLFHIHQDPLIPMEGFLVIGANRHIRRIDELTDGEFSEYSRLIRITRRVISRVFSLEFTTMVEEELSPHFHTWFFPWSPSLLAQTGKPSLSHIRPLMEESRRAGIGREDWAALEGKLERAGEWFSSGGLARR